MYSTKLAQSRHLENVLVVINECLKKLLMSADAESDGTNLLCQISQVVVLTHGVLADGQCLDFSP